MEEVKPPKQSIIIYIIIAIVMIIILNRLIMPSLYNQEFTEVSYGTFLEMIYDHNISQVQINDNEILFSDNSTPRKYYKTGVMNDPDLVNRLYDNGVTEFTQEIQTETSPWVTLLVGYIIPILIFILLWRWIMNMIMKRMGGDMGGGAMTFGKSNAKMYVQSTDGIKFSDVAGEDEAKELLTEIVDYLHNPQRYAEIGANIPKGALLVGPPGTGKTMLAKAVAGEANVPFFSISGSEFVEMFVGMGAAKVRDLFKQANAKAPCIVFIDEIDTIGKKRDSATSIGGNDEREQTLNQLLTEMDGFNANKGVIILGATNRPETLDPALLRPGRFDRRIPVELPDLQGRVEILKVHAKKVKMSDNVDFEVIARMAVGASGAELANMINEAALRAVRNGRKFVTQQDLEESVEVVLAGYQKKNQILTDKEKHIVAYHETGHALVAALQTDSAPVQKITIIPRTSGALGYTMQVEEEEHNLMSKEEIENKIATLTGGRIAEDLTFHSISTGASNDIEQATKLARAMVTRFGMTEEFGMVAMETVQNEFLGGDTSLSCSPETATAIDRKVVDIVKAQYKKAEAILKENKKELDALAGYLYEHETISGEEFMTILHQVQNGEEIHVPEQLTYYAQSRAKLTNAANRTRRNSSPSSNSANNNSNPGQGNQNTPYGPNGSASNGYNSNGYNPNGYNPNGYNPNGYNPNGYNPNGYNPNGYNPNGYNPYGNNGNGYNPYGYNPNGNNPNGYYPNGYDPNGSFGQNPYGPYSPNSQSGTTNGQNQNTSDTADDGSAQSSGADTTNSQP